jgi:hypothetical protein
VTFAWAVEHGYIEETPGRLAAAPAPWPSRLDLMGSAHALVLLDAWRGARAPRVSRAASEDAARAEDRAKIVALEERVRTLERRISELEGGHAREAEQVVPVSPHMRWIASHLDELRRLPNTWVVLDAEKGIVFQTTDEAQLAAQLARYPREDRARLMPFNTRMYV